MILGLDTSSQKISLALYFPKKLEKEISWLTKETSKELLPKIDQFLRENRVKLKDLKAIAVFRGPGSYTGLRVGISIANALAYSLNIPVLGSQKLGALNSAKEAYQKIKSQISNLKSLDLFVTPIYK